MLFSGQFFIVICFKNKSLILYNISSCLRRNVMQQIYNASFKMQLVNSYESGTKVKTLCNTHNIPKSEQFRFYSGNLSNSLNYHLKNDVLLWFTSKKIWLPLTPNVRGCISLYKVFIILSWTKKQSIFIFCHIQSFKQ